MSVWSRTVFVIACLTAASSRVSAAEPVGRCEKVVEIPANGRAKVAYIGVEEWGFFTNKKLRFVAKVKTADGTDMLAQVWTKHSDLARWGYNNDLKSARGPLINFSNRYSFWGVGGVELNVRARNSATTLCICSIYNPDDADAGYESRLKACEKMIRKGTE